MCFLRVVNVSFSIFISILAVSAGVARRVPITDVGVKKIGLHGQAGFTHRGSCVNSDEKVMFFLHIHFSQFDALLFVIKFVNSRSWLRLRPMRSVHCVPAAKGALCFP